MAQQSHQPSSGAQRPRVASRCEEMRQEVAAARAAGQSVGIVPTMGALHEGHLSLVRASLAECDCTVVSIFVNPSQFGPQEDYQSYPRTFEQDLCSLGQCGADLVFAPSAEEIYPRGFSTYVAPPAVAEPWEGRCRPGHFRGVATVVLKLFHVVPADIAYFGAKDYQQTLVIRHMVRDLNVPIQIRLCPTVRDYDGLALSSRNRYLSDEDRERALALPQSLALAAELVAHGEHNPDVVRKRMQRVFQKAGVDRVDYIAVAHPDTLEEVAKIEGPTLVAVAAQVGSARLIDNRLLE